MQDRVWAPWRYPYLKGVDSHGDGCIFCDLPREEDDKKNLIVYRGKRVFVIMNKYPYTTGHLLVVPFSHVDDLEKCSSVEQAELLRMLTLSMNVLRKGMNPEAFNIGMNIGRTAGAGIDEHIHFHIVPRWNGDTNFMSVVADTRVVSMSLEAGWDLLSEKFISLVG